MSFGSAYTTAEIVVYLQSRGLIDQTGQILDPMGIYREAVSHGVSATELAAALDRPVSWIAGWVAEQGLAPLPGDTVSGTVVAIDESGARTIVDEGGEVIAVVTPVAPPADTSQPVTPGGGTSPIVDPVTRRPRTATRRTTATVTTSTPIVPGDIDPVLIAEEAPPEPVYRSRAMLIAGAGLAAAWFFTRRNRRG